MHYCLKSCLLTFLFIVSSFIPFAWAVGPTDMGELDHSRQYTSKQSRESLAYLTTTDHDMPDFSSEITENIKNRLYFYLYLIVLPIILVSGGILFLRADMDQKRARRILFYTILLTMSVGIIGYIAIHLFIQYLSIS